MPWDGIRYVRVISDHTHLLFNVNRHILAEYLKMIGFFSPFGIRHVFLYSIYTNKNEKLPHPLFNDRSPPFYYIKYAYEVLAIRVNTDKATYTFTNVKI